MLPEEPFDPGTELIDMVGLHLLFGLLRVDPVLLLGIRTFESSLIFMETVIGKGAPFGDLAIPGILKCFGCRMSGSDILQADLVRRIRSDGYSFLLIGYSVLLRILADHSVKGQIGFIDLGPSPERTGYLSAFSTNPRKFLLYLIAVFLLTDASLAEAITVVERTRLSRSVLTSLWSSLPL